MKKILVPTDFSNLSTVAFNTAKEIAKKSKAEIHLLHGSFLYDNPGLNKVKKKEAKAEKKHIEHLEKLCKKANKDGIKVKTHYCNTHIVSNVMSYIQNHSIDLIVMATDDYKNKNDYLEESNTLKVVRLAQCPVLVIKDADYKLKTTEIVFASDFNEEALPSFKRLIDFSNQMKLKVNLVRIGVVDEHYKNIENAVRPFVAICDKTNLGIVWEHQDESIEAGINEVSKKFDYCLISICSHHREYDNEFYDDLLSETIVYESKASVLTIPILSEELV